MNFSSAQFRTCPTHGEHTGKACPRCGTKTEMPFHTCHARDCMRLTITGQIRGGKNNIVVTRSGNRFPSAAWAKWRADAVQLVVNQLPENFRPFNAPVNIRLDYFAGDKRRRDMPAIVDSIFHVLEKAGVVTDDWHLWVTESSRGYDKDSPRAVVTFMP